MNILYYSCILLFKHHTLLYLVNHLIYTFSIISPIIIRGIPATFHTGPLEDADRLPDKLQIFSHIALIAVFHTLQLVSHYFQLTPVLSLHKFFL